MATNVELRKSNGANYNEVIHIKTHKSLVEGLLGADGKVLTGLLPAFVLGGMKYVGVISSATTTDNLITQISNWLTTNGISTAEENYVGKYFVATTEVVITRSSGSEFEQSVEGVDGASLTLHSGDWIIYNSYNAAGPTIYHNWGVVNNTYANATEGAAGVIKRSPQAQATAVTPTDNLTAMTPVRVAEHVTTRLGAYTTTLDLNANFASKDDLDSKLDVTAISAWAKKTSLDLSDIPTISVAKGGTGATTASGARTNLGLGSLATKSSLVEGDIPALPQTKITGLVDDLANKSAIGHGHAISDVSNLADTLSGLVPKTTTVNSQPLTGNITITKSDVGLGSVLNYGIAAQTDAKAGTSSTLYMTPLRVKEAIDTFASIPVMAKAPGETGGPTFVAADNPDGKLIMVSI